ncbi:MAG: hypothetical protein IPJ71_02245 [Bdellovibrionales bacterium]|nr:hypothetical protein [Bdellovibrionales bacterium]
MKKAAISLFALLLIPCARAKDIEVKNIDFSNYSITFDSAIFSGDVSSKYRSDKPYILAASSDSNIIGVLECDDSIVSRLDREYLKLTLTDRKWSSTPALALLAMNAEECRSMGDSIVEGRSKIEVHTGKRSNFSYRYASKVFPLKLNVLSAHSEN